MTTFTYKPIGKQFKIRVAPKVTLIVDDAGILYNVPAKACMPGGKFAKLGYMFLYRSIGHAGGVERVVYQGRGLEIPAERGAESSVLVNRTATTHGPKLEVLRTIRLNEGQLTVTTTLKNLSDGDVQVTGFGNVQECGPGCDPTWPCTSLAGGNSQSAVLASGKSMSAEHSINVRPTE
jgi:hypothetical protein